MSLCHLLSNLTWRDDTTDTQAASQPRAGAQAAGAAHQARGAGAGRQRARRARARQDGHLPDEPAGLGLSEPGDEEATGRTKAGVPVTSKRAKRCSCAGMGIHGVRSTENGVRTRAAIGSSSRAAAGDGVFAGDLDLASGAQSVVRSTDPSAKKHGIEEEEELRPSARVHGTWRIDTPSRYCTIHSFLQPSQPPATSQGPMAGVVRNPWMSIPSCPSYPT